MPNATPQTDEVAANAGDTAREELRQLCQALTAHIEQLANAGASGVPASPPFGPPASPPLARSAAPSSRETVLARPVEPAVSSTSAMQEAPMPPRERSPQRSSLQILQESVAACRLCALHATRTQTVFARGTGASGLAFVGEGPGEEEDRQGQPFVGAAGQLLDRMIAAMKLDREEVYVCNIVKCRPPNNRKPDLDEMTRCMPYLTEQLRLIQPRVIVALGATAAQGLLGTTTGITRLRGQWKLYAGKIPVMPTFHPAYLLRQPGAKREVWADLQAVLAQLSQ